MIEPRTNRLPLKTQAELLSLSRSSLYYRKKGPSELELRAKHRIDEIYTAHPFLGSRKITVLLRKEFPISRPTVQRYMRQMAIQAIYPAPRLSRRHPEHKIYPYLLRNVTIARQNMVTTSATPSSRPDPSSMSCSLRWWVHDFKSACFRPWGCWALPMWSCVAQASS